MDNKELAVKLLKRFETLKSARKLNEEQRWFAMAIANHRTKGASLTPSPVPDIVRHTSVTSKAIDDFVNFFVGNLVSPNLPWLGMTYESEDGTDQDDIPNANEYLGMVRKKILAEMAASNFYPQNKLSTMDEYVAANSAVLVTNDPNRKLCNYTTLTPWEYWTDVDRFGEYDTLFYTKTMTIANAFEMFGNKLPKWMLEVIDNDNAFDTWADFLLCIYPRTAAYTGKRSMFAKKRRFAVVWLYMGTSTASNSGSAEVIDESGMDYFPAMVSSWEYDGDNQYGTSPVMRAIEDLKRTDKLAYETLYMLMKIDHPAYNGVRQSFDGFSDDPGSRNIVPTMEMAAQPLQIPHNLEGAMAMQEKQEALVQRIFSNDMFNFLSRDDNAKVYTATQVNAVKSEQLSLLAAVYGNYQRRIEKLVFLTAMTMADNGRLPQGAKDIFNADGKLRVMIESPLAQELRAYTNRDANIALLEQLVVFHNLGLDSKFNNFDLDGMIRKIANGLGVDYTIIRDKVDVEEENAQIAQMQAQQMQLQNDLTASEIARNNAGAANLNNAGGANQYGG